MARLFQVGPPATTGLNTNRVRFAAHLLLLGWLLVGALGAFAAEPSQPKKPKPATVSVSGYGLLGNRELKRILKTVELGGKKPEYFGATFVEDSALILAARVKRDGYLEPTISIRIWLDNGQMLEVHGADLLENPLPRPLRITRVRFTIAKGVLYHFEQLRFEGLETITEKEARAFFMESDTLLHLKTARIFTLERLQRGLSSILEALDREGFTQATAKAERVVRDDRNGSVDVEISVRQGPKMIVRSVREEFFYEASKEPQNTSTVYPNKPYSKLWQQDFVLSLRTNLYHQGFPDTKVELQTLKRDSVDARVYLDLQATVKAGEQFRVGSVDFKGMQRTRKSLLSRRVRVHRGELLDPIKVEEGRYRLSRLGIFDSVSFDYHPDGERVRDVLYDVKEGKRLNVSLLFGYGSYELLRGGVDIEAFNLWGEAHHAELKAIQSFKASSGNFVYTIPEFVGKDVDLFFNGSALRREEVSFVRVEYGGGVGVHKYFQPAALDFSGRYNYQILSAQEFNSIEAVATDGLTNPAVGSVTFELKHDRRDNPLYPRRGYKVFATFETATTYIGGEANYERIDLSASWHHPLGGGRYLSLGLSQGVDVSFGSAMNNLPFNKRYFPGGEASIRGYGEGEASPRNEFGQFVGAETYTLGTVELEQALTTRWSLVLFSDSLGEARRIENYPWDTTLFSVGVGLRWRTLIGPVRLEYGYNLNPRPQDPSGTLQFSLGFPF